MTGLVHDPDHRRHVLPGHPERPERIEAAWEGLEMSGLLQHLSFIPLRSATDEEILRVHDAAVVSHIEQLTALGGGMLDPDTYCTDGSWAIARRICGGIIDLCRGVANKEHPNGLAVVRPPGHHATGRHSMGFCLVNHLAIAARALQNAGLADRVAIVDIDVHHGNGTEDIFNADPTVFFASTHQFPHYPGTGRAIDTGSGPGQGFTLNIPMPAGTGDDAFLTAYTDTIIPAVHKFAPDFLLVSAGLDAHQDDPLAGLMVSDEGFRKINKLLVELAGEVCGGRVVFNLEGGYDLGVLQRCVPDLVTILVEDSRQASP